jgi:uncharacterized protein (DUF1800 family)
VGNARTRLQSVVVTVLAVAALAAQAQAPTQAQPLGEERARVFLARTGFAPSVEEVERFAPLTQAQAVERVLRETTATARTPAPAWIDERMLPPRELRALNEAERAQEQRRMVRQGLELRAWWLTEMVATRSPLTERMTLFWHNHFVSAQPKVRYAPLMYRQNVLLRAHAVGNFGQLLHAVARDPAMLIYLDGVQNRRGQPNENFAREVMELFTLGPGHYTESDIKEAARAFTGWSLDPDGFTFTNRRLLHDGGDKTVLGRTGRLSGDDVLDQLLAHPATARFVVAKLWREFVSPEPDVARVESIAQVFRGSYDIKAALRLLLNQPEVVAPQPEHYLVKSPVELLVGLTRQNLFAAPSVRGWPGGEAWINTQTLLARRQFLQGAVTAQPGKDGMSNALMTTPIDDMTPLARGDALRSRLAVVQANALHVPAGEWLKRSAGLSPERPTTQADVQRLATALGGIEPVTLPAAGELSLDVLRTLLLDPSYQLK